jgi:hypothetical protein
VFSIRKGKNMKVRYIDADSIPVNADINLGDLMKIDEIFTDIGADWRPYGSAVELHKRVKIAIEDSLKRLNWKSEHLDNSFNKVIEYKVIKETAREDA